MMVASKSRSTLPETPMTHDPKPRRRRFRYSLRALLVFVTIASAGFGWLGLKMRQANRQREAVEAIRELGGNVSYDYEFKPKGALDYVPTPPGPVWLRTLFGIDLFANVVSVECAGP